MSSSTEQLKTTVSLIPPKPGLETSSVEGRQKLFDALLDALLYPASTPTIYRSHKETQPEHSCQARRRQGPRSLFNKVLEKLRSDPLSISVEDARRLSEQVEPTDMRAAKIVSAVESLAIVGHEFKAKDSLVHNSRHTQAALVNDLRAAVEDDPTVVTAELLKSTQSIVQSKPIFHLSSHLPSWYPKLTLVGMQRALGKVTAPCPELEPELQAEIAKIEPKIEQGTVSREEADHLHSLESRVHGHTVKGGITAMAQSVVAKREKDQRARTLSSSTNESVAVQCGSPGLTKSSAAVSSSEDTTAVSMADLNIKDEKENKVEGELPIKDVQVP